MSLPTANYSNWMTVQAERGNLANYRPRFFRKITPSADVLSPPPIALYFAEAGTITIVDAGDGTEADIPVVAGGHLYLQVTKLTAASGDVYGYF